LLVFAASCGRKQHFSMQEQAELPLEESEEHYLAGLPSYLLPVGKEAFALINDENELLVYSIGDGKLKKVLIPAFDTDKYIAEEAAKDTGYQIAKTDDQLNSFLKNYPKYSILAFSEAQKDKAIPMFYRVTNPILVNKSMIISFINLLLESDQEGKVLRYRKIMINTAPLNMSFVPYSGFYFNSDSSVLYTNAVSETHYKVVISAFALKNGQYVNVWNKLFPFPLDLKKTKLVDESKPNTFYAKCDFQRMGDSLYFLNGKDLYNFYTGRLTLSADAIAKGDSVHFIESFVILPGDDNKAAFFACKEYVLPKTDDYENMRKFLVVRSARTGKVYARVPMNMQTSGIMYQDGYLYYLENKDENIVIKKYKVNFKP